MRYTQCVTVMYWWSSPDKTSEFREVPARLRWRGLHFAPPGLPCSPIKNSPEGSPMSSLANKQGPRYRHTADGAEPYETIGVEKLTPIIGAEISGVDLASSLSNRTMDEIHRALAENLVIFFRDQRITPDQHLAFGRKFGELHVHPAAPNEGDPALMKIYADKDSPRANGE